MSRRRFLAAVCGGLAALPLGDATRRLGATGLGAARRGRREGAPRTRAASEPGERSLCERAAAKGLFFGCATTEAVLARDPAFAERVAAECGLLVPESELKWNRVHPEPGRFVFGPADRLDAFAAAHRMMFRGHVLLYFMTDPAWATAGPAPSVERAVRDHIRAVAGHYAGRMQSWDVVNEILELGDRRTDGLRATPLLRALGPEYVALAFETAAAADPKALLVWNDNQLEYDLPYQGARREAALRLLEGWRAAGVPIHALGIQSHLRAHGGKFDGRRYREFLAEVARLGASVILSELDVFDADLPADPARRDPAVAGAYEEYLDAALDEPAVLGVVTWGLSDRYTWLAGYKPRVDGARARPLPYDESLRPTAAWYAIARALDAAPRRKAGT